MLSSLEVTDFANVSHATLELPEEGFCVLTGETGVGKSLLIDALSLCLGARVDRDYVRHGKDKAEVSAAFCLDEDHEARAWLLKNSMEDSGGELVVRRRVDSRRRSKAHINGKMATATQLGDLIGLLVGICGQHEHLRIRHAARRRELLDQAAGATGPAHETAVAYLAWRESVASLEKAKEIAVQALERKSQIGEFLAEIDSIGLGEDKWKSENELLERQGNAAEISQLYSELAGKIEALESDLASSTELGSRLADLLPQAKGVYEQLSEMSGLANDIVRDHARISEAIGEVDEQILEQAESFVSEAHRLSRKHKAPNPLVLLEKADSLRKELEGLETSSVEEAGKKEIQAKEDLLASAAKLTKARVRKSKELSTKVRGTLRKLGMPAARFEIALDPLKEVARHGSEEVNFHFAARKTMKLSDLGEVASGGELSRASLALFAHVGGDGNKDMVFDEVDNGIGGKTAAHVGGLLAEMGKGRVVLCVTHLPQVAAAARHHWIVSADENGTARLDVAQGKDREEEIARMLAGRRITEASRDNAREILAAYSA